MDSFTPGQIVTIREWDDMEAEFGINSSGYIDCEKVFTNDMRYLCGRTFEVTDINSEGYAYIDMFTIPTDMIVNSLSSTTKKPILYKCVACTKTAIINRLLSDGYIITHTANEYVILQLPQHIQID